MVSIKSIRQSYNIWRFSPPPHDWIMLMFRWHSRLSAGECHAYWGNIENHAKIMPPKRPKMEKILKIFAELCDRNYIFQHPYLLDFIGYPIYTDRYLEGPIQQKLGNPGIPYMKGNINIFRR